MLNDTHLLALTAEFHRTYAECCVAHQERVEARRRVEALPDCPPCVAPAFDRAGSERYDAFVISHGLPALWERFNALDQRVGELCSEILATPAKTIQGAIERLKIVRLASGDGPDTLGCCQAGSQTQWIATAIDDMERLATAT